MKTKKEQDKSNTVRIAQFEFFFNNEIIEQRFGAVWSIDYGKMLNMFPKIMNNIVSLNQGDRDVFHDRILPALME